MKIIKQNYKKLFGIALILNMIWLSVIGVLVLSQASNTFTITSGIYPSAPTYTIYLENSVYYAKDEYGVLRFFSNDDAGQVTTSCVNVIGSTNKGNIYYTSGEFIFKTNVKTTKYKTFYGSGISTLLKTYSDIGIFNVTGDEVTIKDMKIASYYGASVSASGIHIHQQPNIWIDNVFVENFKHGILAYGANTWGLFITNSIFHNNTQFGVYFNGYSGSKIKNCHFSGSVDINTVSGVVIDAGATYNEISGNHFDDMNQGIELNGTGTTVHHITIVGNEFERIRNVADIYVKLSSDVTIGDNAIEGENYGYHGIYIDESSFITISGNVISHKGRHGIFIDKTGNRSITVTGNVIRGNSRETHNTYHGIEVWDTDGIVITGNLAIETSVSGNRQKYGIHTGGNADYNIITNNHCFGNVDATQDINYVGSNNKVAYNIARYTPQGVA